MAFGIETTNWLIVLVAAVVAYVFGALWHGPLFGRYWMKMMGFTKNSIKSMKLNPAKAMTFGFIATLVVSYILSNIINYVGIIGLSKAFWLALFLWIGFSVPILLGSYLWEGKSFKLFIFNSVYRLIELEIMAIILTLWA